MFQESVYDRLFLTSPSFTTFPGLSEEAYEVPFIEGVTQANPATMLY